MLNLYFYFLQFFLKIPICEKSDKDKKLRGKTKTNHLCYLFPAISRHCQDVSQKLPKLFNIRNAFINNIVYCGYTTKPRFRSLYSCIRQYTRSLVTLFLTGLLPVSLSLILLLGYASPFLKLAHFYNTILVDLFFYVYLF